MTEDETWLLLAQISEPEGRFCGFCGQVNDFADDIGYFYADQDDKTKETLPVCKECWDGEVGARHQLRHGIGER